MQNDKERVIDVIKKQAKIFLLDAKEFYPFGTYINRENDIVPAAAHSASEFPASQELIDILERDFIEGIKNDDYKIAVLATDISIKKNGLTRDGIEMRFFEPGKDVYSQYYTYTIKKDSVDFSDYQDL